MNNNELFKIKDTDKIYRFYLLLTVLPLTRYIFKEEGYCGVNCFRNLCTFLRYNIYLLILVVSLINVIGYIVYTLYTFDFSIDKSTNIFQVFSILFLVLFPFVVFILISGSILGSLLANLFGVLNKRVKKEKQPNLFIQAIKDKHNKVCRSFSIERKY